MGKLWVKGLILVVSMFIALAVYSANSATPIKVVTSIKPLALLTKLALGDIADVHTLVPTGASPHDYALKVSDRRALAEADLVVWVGPQMERFLERVVDQLPAKQVVTLEQLPGLVWPDEVQNGHHHHHDNHHHDDHGSRDLHLWLNPDNGLRVVEALAVRMGLALSSDVAALRALVAELRISLNLRDHVSSRYITMVMAISLIGSLFRPLMW